MNGNTADLQAEGEILERKEWPKPTRALRSHGLVCNVKGKEHADKCLGFENRVDKLYHCFFFYLKT